MSKLRAKNIEPATGTTLTLGASGDTIAVSSDSVQANTWQDTGGNSLFVSDGSGTLSSVNSGLAGAGYKLIESQTVDSAVASIEFTSGIDSTYDEYAFVMVNVNPVSYGAFQFQGSTDGGSNYNVTITSTFFMSAQNDGGSGEFTYQTVEDQAQGTAYQYLTEAGGVGASANQSAGIILQLFSPASTTYVKHFYSTCSRYQQIGGTHLAGNDFAAGYFNTTSAINAISFKFSSGNTDGGTIDMYGVS